MKKKVLALLIIATANAQSSETKTPDKLIAQKDALVFENGVAADQNISSENSEPERLKVRLDMAKAEELLWKNNLLLLAAKYDIDARKAGIEQAGLYANPNIFIDQSIFAEPTRRYFDFTRSGQTVYQIQQLFLLGGKIDKRIRVAELNAKMGEQEFYDLARALLSKLRRTLYFIHYYREAISFYDGSLEALERTVSSAELAYKRRAILQAELLRLKALLFFLRKEREDLRIRVLEKEADLRVLLNEEKYMDQGIAIQPVLNQDFVEGIDLAKIKLAEIVQTAREYRPDLRKAVQALRYEEANLELQHANAIPDLSFGPMYNRGGTAFQNYWGVTAQVNIPIFDRNQGNIKAAEKSILVKKQELKNRILEVENEVNVALATAKAKDGLYRRFRNTYTKDYTDLAQDMILSYEKRYISVLEFADFFETYRSSIVEMLRLQTDRMDAIEGVNYSVGSGVLVPNKPSVESGNN
ncbi:outer membrane efflux protein [Leptospira broomii serovar Hurstbridge str. 5399]|uniref:Outer membrane efflux protein n=1 Tax=Leptospira broomii serovar Hurstbridge str. 5399 TaxID=1049789 RepID=T0GP08_9LEPT|nr:TolC family protein [Leptospira broomii]EQA47043.1 outer membrane efflux protein [Leptospira broomii serovar Hurstbridge str. 5399]